MRSLLLATAVAVWVEAASAATLVGYAVLPADTFSPGPTSGQFIGAANGRTPPFAGRQPVQGISAIIAGPTRDTWIVMQDNGFGTQGNSADIVLRLYGVKPDWSTGRVHPVDIRSGAMLPEFEPAKLSSNFPIGTALLRSPIQADLDSILWPR
ncbi:MAG: hypothetical protein RML45_05365 [Acetobacteraceae bacterium]|nr:hypothetical protein [Acetobacteraceae bacterium]